MRKLTCRLGALVATVVFAAAASAARADDAPASLRELFAIIAKGHPELRSGQAARDAADIGVNDAYFGFLPRASLVIDQSTERQEVFRTDNPTYQVGAGTYGNYQRAFQVIQPLIDPRAFAQLYSAQATSERAKSSYDSVRQTLVYALIESYLTALSSHDAYQVALSEEKAMRTHLEEMSDRKTAGLAQLGDVSEVEARLETARAQRANAGAALIEAFATLDRRVGAPVGPLAPLSATITLVPPSPDVESWIDSSRANYPDLRALKAAVDAADAAVYSAIASHLPRLELHYTDTHLETGGSLYGGGSTTSERIAMLRYTIPLFNVEGNGYTMFAAAERKRQAEADMDTKRFQLDEQVRTAFTEATVSARRATLFANAVAAQDRAVKSKQERFRSGVISVTAVLDAEKDYYQARRSLLGARYNYLLNMMQLKHLAGDISEQDLAFMDTQLDPGAGTVTKAEVTF